MAAPKGFRPPAAGRGRVKGVPNRTPAALREVVALFVEKNAEGAQALYDRVAKHNPARALELLARFAEFVLPRQREVSGTLTTVNFDANAVVTDVAEAARIYQSIMSDPTLDTVGLRFATLAPAALEQDSSVAVTPANLPRDADDC